MQVNKGAGQLNQALVKRTIGPVSLSQPQLFQYVVRLVETLGIEALEERQVVGVQVLSLKRRDGSGDLRAPAAHGKRMG